MFDNITIFYNDAEFHSNYFNAAKIIRLLHKRIDNGEKTAQNYAFLADAYNIKHNIQKAIKYALKSKQIDPDYYYADFLLTFYYAEEHKFAKAEKYFNILLESAPDDYYFKYMAGCYLYNAKSNQLLVKKFANKILQLELEENPDSLFVYSAAYGWMLDYKNSIKYSLKALKGNFFEFNLAYWWLFLGALLAFVGEKFSKNEKLLEFLQKSYRFSRCLFLSKDEKYYEYSEPFSFESPEKCLENIEKAIKLNSTPVYLIRKAELLMYNDRVEEAIEILENILQEDKSYTRLYYCLRIAYEFLDDTKKQLEYANLDLLNNPMDIYSYYAKVNILRKLGRYDEAINVLKQLEKNIPDVESLNFFYATIYRDIKDYKKALLYINKQLLIEQKDMYYREKLIYLCNLEYWDEACEVYKNIKEPDGLVYYLVAVTYGRLERYKEALSYINKSLLLDGDDKYSYYIKSEILEALDRIIESKQAYAKAIEFGL